MGYIYIIKNTINGKCYIGQTTRAVKKRIRSHFRKNSGCLLKNVLEVIFFLF